MSRTGASKSRRAAAVLGGVVRWLPYDDQNDRVASFGSTGLCASPAHRASHRRGWPDPLYGSIQSVHRCGQLKAYFPHLQHVAILPHAQKLPTITFLLNRTYHTTRLALILLGLSRWRKSIPSEIFYHLHQSAKRSNVRPGVSALRLLSIPRQTLIIGVR